MELFTEIEFNKDEFNKIEQVLATLQSEGWDVIHNDDYKSMENNEFIVVAKKYFFHRKI